MKPSRQTAHHQVVDAVAGQGLDQVTTADGTTTNIYDTTNNRVARIDADGTRTVYLGSTEIRWTSNNGIQFARTYGQTRRGFDGYVTHFSINHQGTIAATTSNDLAAAPVRLRTQPYGTPRALPNGAHDLEDRNYLGQPDDPGSSTVYLNARHLLPEVGAFLSADPLLVLDDPASLNPYSYAHGRPTSMSDRSGLRPDFDHGSGQAERWFARRNGRPEPPPRINVDAVEQALRDVVNPLPSHNPSGSPGLVGPIGGGAGTALTAGLTGVAAIAAGAVAVAALGYAALEASGRGIDLGAICLGTCGVEGSVSPFLGVDLEQLATDNYNAITGAAITKSRLRSVNVLVRYMSQDEYIDTLNTPGPIPGTVLLGGTRGRPSGVWMSPDFYTASHTATDRLSMPIPPTMAVAYIVLGPYPTPTRVKPQNMHDFGTNQPPFDTQGDGLETRVPYQTPIIPILVWNLE